MKKIFVLSAFLLLLCTTGCIKYSYNIEIDSKDNINVSEIEAINLSVMESFSGNITKEMDKNYEENKKEYENEGYTVEKYKDDTYSGVKRIKKYKLSNYLATHLPDGFSAKNDKPVLIHKGLFKTTYDIDLQYDFSKVSQKQDKKGYNPYGGESSNTDYNDSDSLYINGKEDKIVSREKTTNPSTGEITERIKYESGATSSSTYNPKDMENFGNAVGNVLNSAPGMAPVADLTIKIPCKAKEHNAKEVISDTEYKWNLISQTPVDISIKYEKINVLNIIVISIIALLLTGLVIINIRR